MVGSASQHPRRPHNSGRERLLPSSETSQHWSGAAHHCPGDPSELLGRSPRYSGGRTSAIRSLSQLPGKASHHRWRAPECRCHPTQAPRSLSQWPSRRTTGPGSRLPSGLVSHPASLGARPKYLGGSPREVHRLSQSHLWVSQLVMWALRATSSSVPARFVARRGAHVWRPNPSARAPSASRPRSAGRAKRMRSICEPDGGQWGVGGGQHPWSNEWRWVESNHLPRDYETLALPVSYTAVDSGARGSTPERPPRQDPATSNEGCHTSPGEIG